MAMKIGSFSRCISYENDVSWLERMDSELQDSEKCPSNSTKRGVREREREKKKLPEDFWGIEKSRETEEGFEVSRLSK